MEARKEQLEKKQNEQVEMGKAREVIREAIITKDDNKKKNMEKAEDILAYSRAVHQTDSPLQ